MEDQVKWIAPYDPIFNSLTIHNANTTRPKQLKKCFGLFFSIPILILTISRKSCSIRDMFTWVRKIAWIRKCWKCTWLLKVTIQNHGFTWFLTRVVIDAATQQRGATRTKTKTRKEAGRRRISCHRLGTIWGTFLFGDLRLAWEKAKPSGLGWPCGLAWLVLPFYFKSDTLLNVNN